jgi:glutaminyl-tRNA synthetase
VGQAHSAAVNLYDRLYQDGDERLNPDSKKSISARLEPALRAAPAGAAVQFERHGYFVADAAAQGFNRTVTLRDSWAKA